MRKNNGQAAILTIFVVGMAGLLIGMSLTKTGFGTSMMGRGSVNSTYAFYVANAGIEDALYKVQQEEYDNAAEPYSYNLPVGEGEAQVRINGSETEKEILSIGSYKNYVS